MTAHANQHQLTTLSHQLCATETSDKLSLCMDWLDLFIYCIELYITTQLWPFYIAIVVMNDFIGAKFCKKHIIEKLLRLTLCKLYDT